MHPGGAEWCAGGGGAAGVAEWGAPPSPPLPQPGQGQAPALVSVLQLLRHLPATEASGASRGKSCLCSRSAGPGPHPQAVLRGGRWAALSCLIAPSYGSGHGRDPACPHVPPPHPPAKGVCSLCWWGETPPHTPSVLALGWPWGWVCGYMAAPAAAPAWPCPPGAGGSTLAAAGSLPGREGGRAGRHGTAASCWVIKGGKGRREENTPPPPPRRCQLMELAPGWGRVGTMARLACLPGWRGRGPGEGLRGRGHPFAALMTHPDGCVALVRPAGATAVPLFGIGGTPCGGLAACRG